MRNELARILIYVASLRVLRVYITSRTTDTVIHQIVSCSAMLSLVIYLTVERFSTQRWMCFDPRAFLYATRCRALATNSHTRTSSWLMQYDERVNRVLTIVHRLTQAISLLFQALHSTKRCSRIYFSSYDRIDVADFSGFFLDAWLLRVRTCMLSTCFMLHHNMCAQVSGELEP